MTRPSASSLQLKAARAKAAQLKRSASSALLQPNRNIRPRQDFIPEPTVSPEHWMEIGQQLEDEEETEVEISDSEEDLLDVPKELAGTNEEFQNAFKVMLEKAKEDPWNKIKFPYQRGPKPCRKTVWEHGKKNDAAKKVQEDQKVPKMTDFFTLQPGPVPVVRKPSVPSPPPPVHLEEAIKSMEAKLQKKKPLLSGQNLMRHRAVLIFLNFQASLPGTRLALATLAAKGFRRGVYLARKIITWERQWRDSSTRQIEEGKRGCHVKTRSWFNDEGVQLAARSFIQKCGPKQFSAYTLAKAIGDHLESSRATNILQETFVDAGLEDAVLPRTRRIKARTARSWLGKMGFKYCRVTKTVFIDGHERDDVVAYREEFVKTWLEYRKRMVIFKEDGSYELPEGCKVGSDGNYYMEDGSGRPLVLVTHDESTFNANDGKRSGWFKMGSDGKPNIPIEPKSRGKGIMVSCFLTPGGILRVPDSVSDAELLKDASHPLTSDGTPVRQAVKYLEYGKDNYWTGDMMVEHTIKEAIPIFRRAFPKFQALFAFDNASNHCAFSHDALVTDRMNLNDGGKVPLMQDTYFYKDGPDRTKVLQTMYYPNSPEIPASKRLKPKGMRTILQERGLWPEGGRNILQDKFLADCPTSDGRPGCPTDRTDPDLGKAVGICCARTMLRNQEDFMAQKSRLEEEVEARMQLVIFYPKFHCELNFIERFWASAKYYARENCQYDLAGLRLTIPAALESVSTVTINRFYKGIERTIDAYADPAKYKFGTKEFQERPHQNSLDFRP
ncbi:hypothetical protein BJ508DRAFT_375057 [Ascobolus immersus RN42]|uniref:Uncharacterized protein n=1 Tax=Ascobolus immersus RN42 TaxID=1160509 RepID=A0A3N4IH48_ASCIM|nr:hypothetical protein BJ508DRAFT_375057 [Ascobolus immersus RN42]